ncbi:MAG: 30S ribosomal protein S1, partial [Candidatus Omnitrophica bacterium]|nr:30S ribosomal protein S1 [Candidatus Omnitrophota bacterium]
KQAEEEFLDEEDHADEPDPEMAALIEGSFEMPKVGSVVSGYVQSITKDDVMVSIGGKSEGLISRREFQADGDDLKVGATFDLVYRGIKAGQPILSRSEARQRVGQEKIQKAFEEGLPIEVFVQRRTKGGLKVEAEGFSGFMPFSHTGVRRGHEAEIEAMVGTKIPALVVEAPKGKDMVVSRRLLLDRKNEQAKKEVLNRIEEGQSVRGKVKHLTSFGAFIDLGGVDGLLHVKDMSWGHVAKPDEVVSLGQEIDAVVVSIEGEKIGLGLKQKSEDPWETVEEKFPTGGKVRGKVTSLTNYGAFVEIGDGIEGLIHISEMSWTKRIRHPKDMLKVGDEVEAVILSIDKDKRRVALGYKQTTEDPWQLVLREYPEGSTVSGKVVSLTNYGAFVQIAEGVDGMVHVSDLAWGKKINHPNQVLKEGDVVQARVLKIDEENRKVSLGMKQATPDPWEVAKSKFAEGTVVEATVTNLTDFGAFADVGGGIEGLIHVSEISTDRVDKPSDVLTKGQKVKVMVTKTDWENNKIGLSIKACDAKAGSTDPTVGSVEIPSEYTDPDHLEEEGGMSEFGEILSKALSKDRSSNEDE